MSDIDDPFATEPDEDPFATPDDVKGGAFTPTPPFEALDGHLVVMVPRSFRDDAPIPEEYRTADGPKVRDQYTVDMVILDGPPVTFEYNGPIKVDGKRDRLSTTVTEFPALFTGVWRVEASIVGQLKKVDGSARPMLLGVLRRGPQAKDRQAGKTFEHIAFAFDAWRKNPKGMPPRFSWQIDTAITPEQKAAAMSWWNAAKASGFKLTK